MEFLTFWAGRILVGLVAFWIILEAVGALILWVY